MGIVFSLVVRREIESGRPKSLGSLCDKVKIACTNNSVCKMIRLII